MPLKGPVLDTNLPQAINDSWHKNKLLLGTGGTPYLQRTEFQATLISHKRDVKAEVLQLIRSEGAQGGGDGASSASVQNLYGNVAELVERLQNVERCNAVCPASRAAWFFTDFATPYRTRNMMRMHYNPHARPLGASRRGSSV